MQVARSSSTPPGQGSGKAQGEKWWHVPDGKIEELVRGLDATPEQAATMMRRSVRFEGDNGDALDQLMRRSFTRSKGEPWRPTHEGDTRGLVGREMQEEQDEEEEYYVDDFGRRVPRKKWHVSENQLLEKIAKMAEDGEAVHD